MYNVDQKNNEIFPSLQRWTLGLYRQLKVTVGLDSTVLERYGEQEGSRRGYNPRKPGRPSHHPLIAFIAELKVVANGWLRPGNTSSCNNMVIYFEETFSLFAGLVIGNSGFFSEKCLNFFEESIVHCSSEVYHVHLEDACQRSTISANTGRHRDSGVFL